VWNLSELRSRRRGRSAEALQTAGQDWSEAELADAWAERRYRAHWLVDCCGRHLRVVFPGRRWGGPGPDFLGAVLALDDGTLVRGDVEVHVRASSWAGHRHAVDPAYRQVVLHVVARADALALDGLGRHVPTVVLVPEREPPRSAPLPCVRAAPAVLSIVQAAGRERFRARVARFEGDLAALEGGPAGLVGQADHIDQATWADQVLWRALAEALGFRRNTQPFGQLAEAVPWSLAA
jgi:hypothetical protein